jgi:glycosyltransferase involved in cell wall biosynthesis
MTPNAARSASRNPLRIAVVAACPFPTLQGSQVLIRQHAQAMAARGHAVHIVAYHLGLRARQSSATQAPVGDGYRLHRIPAIPFFRRMRSGPSIGKPLLDLLLALKLFRVARRERIDVFHAHNVEGVLAAWPAARLLRKPIVFHAHTLMAAELPAYFESAIARNLAARIGRWLDACLPRLANCTIVLSQEARAAFAGLGTPQDRLVHIPPGIEERQFGVRATAGDVHARYKLGDGPLAIYTGNLDPYQGLDDLLCAFSRVRRAVPLAQLIIASHATPNGSLDLSGDGVRYLPVRDFDEAAALLAAGDVAVCPRPACFGYPIKLLNYMSAGKAIVCAAGSARGIDHLDNGYVYPDGDIEALAAGLIRILSDPSLAVRLGRRAAQNIERYRWSILAESYEALYCSLLRDAAASPQKQEFALTGR